MDAKNLGNFVIFDNKLMIIEQSINFPEELLGDIASIAYHSRKLTQDNQTLLDIQFEKSNIIVMKNEEEKASICSLNRKK